jgi:PRTRC genetic system protein C
MLLATQLPRIFRFDNKGNEVELPDPEPNFSPESVLNFFAGTYPILTTAKIEGPEIVNDCIEYKFVTTLGTKG